MDIKTNGDIALDEGQQEEADILGDCWDGLVLNAKTGQRILYVAAKRGVMTKEERAKLQDCLERIREDVHQGCSVLAMSSNMRGRC